MREWFHSYCRASFTMLSICLSVIILSVGLLTMCNSAEAAPPKSSTRSKFYDFSEQLIDGQIRKPTTLYVDTRSKVRFERLLRLKKSFLPQLFKTAKEKIFK